MAPWLIAIAVAPMALALVVACIRDPMRVALPLYAALIPFGGGLALGTSRYGSLSSLSGLLLALGLGLQLMTTRRSARSLSAPVPIWLLFLGLAVASGLWSVDRSLTINALAVLISLVVVYVLVAVSDVDRSVLRRVENGLLAGGVAAALYGMYQLILLGGFEGSTTGRFGRDLLGPGLQAVSMIYPLVIALSRALRRGDGRAGRIAYALVAVFLFWGILMTASRTGTMATGVVLAALAWAGPRESRKAILMSLAGLLVAAAIVWGLHPAGLAERSYASPTSPSGRTDIWRVGLAACSTYCGFGSGWGTFSQVYADTQASVPGARVLVGQGTYKPHNVWLLGMVEMGLLGLVLLALGLSATLVQAYRLPRELRGPPFSVAVGVVFALFFLPGLEFKFFWMLMMMVAMNHNLAQRESQQGSEDRLERDAGTPSPAVTGDPA